MLVYRVNRVPDKLHLALLELLGIRLAPPTRRDARAALPPGARRPTSRSPSRPAAPRSARLRTATEESIVFQTTEDFTIPPLAPAAYVVERGGACKTSRSPAARPPQGPDQRRSARRRPSATRSTWASRSRLARLMVRIDVDCSAGARRRASTPRIRPCAGRLDPGELRMGWRPRSSPTPPAASTTAAAPSSWSSGSRSGIESVGGKRCPLAALPPGRPHAQRRRVPCSPTRPRSTASPRRGRRAGSRRCTRTGGRRGPRRQRRHARSALSSCGTRPCSPPARWTRRSRSASPAPRPGSRGSARSRSPRVEPEDRHFVVDAASGEVALGPPSASPTAAGGSTAGARQGRRTALLELPPRRRPRRQRRGRHADHAQEAIPSVASVTNPGRRGGLDREPLQSARARAPMEIRTRHRAVTADDFEFLCQKASPRVARAICLPTGGGGDAVQILPRVPIPPPPPRARRADADEGLLNEVAAYLDERRQVGTTVQLAPVRLRGITVVVNVQAAPRADLGRVERDIGSALRLPEPAGRRVGERRPRTAGSSAGRSTRASCTASFTRSRASNSSRSSVSTRPTSRPDSRRPSRPARTSSSARRADRLGPHVVKASTARSFRSCRRGNDPPRIAERASRPPPSAGGSARAYLRSGPPSIYHSPGQGGQWALRILCGGAGAGARPGGRRADRLAAYLDPDLAPLQMVDAMAAWLGIAANSCPRSGGGSWSGGEPSWRGGAGRAQASSSPCTSCFRPPAAGRRRRRCGGGDRSR